MVDPRVKNSFPTLYASHSGRNDVGYRMIWMSTIDNNAWAPDVYGWEEVAGD